MNVVDPLSALERDSNRRAAHDARAWFDAAFAEPNCRLAPRFVELGDLAVHADETARAGARP
jgi:hypothetical protein